MDLHLNRQSGIKINVITLFQAKFKVRTLLSCQNKGWSFSFKSKLQKREVKANMKPKF